MRDGTWTQRPRTILVDSEQLESGEALSTEFKRVAAVEIEEFTADYLRRFPGRSAEDIDDAQILREVMNTVGKEGKLGEPVRCVVSVSMLTEGWDANTVTHILGVRAFGTQLLCEQVVGRGLRRRSYAADENGFFTPEYADVYGVPFQFIPTVAKTRDLTLKPTRRVHADPDRAAGQITFPRLTGYRIELPDEELWAEFTERSHLIAHTVDLPTETVVSGLIGVGRHPHPGRLAADPRPGDRVPPCPAGHGTLPHRRAGPQALVFPAGPADHQGLAGPVRDLRR